MTGQYNYLSITRPVRFNYMLIISTATFVIFIIAIWHRRDDIPINGPHYITGSRHQLSFYEIALKHGTDKVTDNRYQYMYESRLSPLRDQKFKMLEIGLGCTMNYGPGASYYTWLEYFPYVDLYYIEYDADCAANWANKTAGATIFTGDQGDVLFLQKFIVESGGEFDVIIDDGGHTMDQQKTSLQVLWDVVKPGGIYFIEDVHTSYIETYGGGFGKAGTFMEDMKSILDDMNKHPGPDKQSISKDIIKFDFVQGNVALTKRNPALGDDGRIGESWLN